MAECCWTTKNRQSRKWKENNEVAFLSLFEIAPVVRTCDGRPEDPRLRPLHCFIVGFLGTTEE